MESENAKLIFDAVKFDDVKAFSGLISSNADLKIRYGRFPLLSLCYLFKSYKILSKYETAMLSIGNYNFVFEENFEIYKKFKRYAKKALRLYLGEEKIVQPAEMLAILDKRDLLVYNYKKLYKTEKIAENIKKIYSLNQNQNIEISTASVSIKMGGFKFRQKVLVMVLAIIFASFAMVSAGTLLGLGLTSGLGTANCPVIISNEEEFLTAINGGKMCYKLNSDITLSSEIVPKNFSGVLDGNGHKIFGFDKIKNSLFNEISGTIKNLKVDIQMDNFDVQSDYAVLAKAVTGKVENCEIFGSIISKILLFNIESTENAFLSVFAANNAGEILNCKSCVNIQAINNSGKDIYISGISGENSGLIRGCENHAEKFDVDTVDLAGIVAINRGNVNSCNNYANLKQTTALQWHPNCGGIAIANEGRVENCKNFGEVWASSVIETKTENAINVFVAGIVVENIGEVEKCSNSGAIFGEAKIAIVLASGVVCRNIVGDGKTGTLISSGAQCNILARSDNSNAYASGIVAINTGIINASRFEGKIDASSGIGAVGAGLCAENYYGKINECFSSVTFAKHEDDSNEIKVCSIRFVFELFPTISGLVSGNTYVHNEEDVASCCAYIKASSSWLYYSDTACGCVEVQDSNTEGLEVKHE